MKSLRKAIIIILVAAFCLSMFTMTASAKTLSNDGGVLSCTSAYEQILYRTATSIANVANARIDQLVYQAQHSPCPNIPLLVWRTNQISAIAICSINALGFDAECVYEEYIIAGQTVSIDPIIVIKRK